MKSFSYMVDAWKSAGGLADAIEYTLIKVSYLAGDSCPIAWARDPLWCIVCPAV